MLGNPREEKMSMKVLAVLSCLIFLAFGVMLGIGAGLSARDEAYSASDAVYDLALRVDDNESKIRDIEWRLE